MNCLWLTLIPTCLCAAAVAEELYPLGPDSQRRDVPHGVVTHHTWTSRIFPGTVRDYWVYVPAQYSPDKDKPACLMVFQDGGGFVNEQSRWRIPVVFDNLIQDRAMPVTIGIFINPGFLPPPGPDMPGRPNRSFEYDAVSDRYARFLIEEILPEVGKEYRLSPDPNDRAICGASSGGICAFTAAWFRPDAFRRVLSFVGSFSNLRGGDAYPSLIRKTETKPIRVFIQSGKRDMNTYAGSWYVQNQAMAAAFEYMGYDYKVVLGEEGHNDLQGGAILPDALRWLWRDWPKPIAAPHPPDSREWATNIVVPGKPWEPVAQDIQDARCVAADATGTVYVAAGGGMRLLRLDAGGTAAAFKDLAGPVSGMAFGPDGRLWTSQDDRLVAYAADGAEAVIATGGHPCAVAVDRRGGIYFADPAEHRVCYVDSAHNQRVAYEGISCPGGLRLLPGGSLLAVTDPTGRWAWSLQVLGDGSLAAGQAFYRLETTDQTSATGAAGVATDTDGYVYVATELGIQVCDQEGRTAFIIANPPGGRADSIAFGGSDLHTLYAVAAGKLYRRSLTRKGA